MSVALRIAKHRMNRQFERVKALPALQRRWQNSLQSRAPAVYTSNPACIITNPACFSTVWQDIFFHQLKRYITNADHYLYYFSMQRKENSLVVTPHLFEPGNQRVPRFCFCRSYVVLLLKHWIKLFMLLHVSDIWYLWHSRCHTAFRSCSIKKS